MSVEKAICPCGCGEIVPRKGHNTWKHGESYWEWMCHNLGCKWLHQGWRNQTGDPTCSVCGHPRELIGHFAKSDGSWARWTVMGKKVTKPNLSSFYWKGRGLMEGDSWEGTLSETSIPTEDRG